MHALWSSSWMNPNRCKRQRRISCTKNPPRSTKRNTTPTPLLCTNTLSIYFFTSLASTRLMIRYYKCLRSWHPVCIGLKSGFCLRLARISTKMKPDIIVCNWSKEQCITNSWSYCTLKMNMGLRSKIGWRNLPTIRTKISSRNTTTLCMPTNTTISSKHRMKN